MVSVARELSLWSFQKLVLLTFIFFYSFVISLNNSSSLLTFFCLLWFYFAFLFLISEIGNLVLLCGNFPAWTHWSELSCRRVCVCMCMYVWGSCVCNCLLLSTMPWKFNLLRFPQLWTLFQLGRLPKFVWVPPPHNCCSDTLSRQKPRIHLICFCFLRDRLLL